MDNPKVPRLRPQSLPIMSINDVQLEQCVVITRVVVFGPGGDLLVGRHEWRRNVVCEEVRLRADVQELDDVVVADDAPTSSSGECLSRDNLPVVIGIVVPIASNLLTCSDRSTFDLCLVMTMYSP